MVPALIIYGQMIVTGRGKQIGSTYKYLLKP